MTSIPIWQPGDGEAIRRALSIPVLPQALQAIDNVMAALLQTYPSAIPTAQGELAAIAAIDAQLAELRPEQLQAPIEIRRSGAISGAIGPDGELPVSKADVIEYATDLLKEELITRYQQPIPPELLLRRQRTSHCQALLLLLPSLSPWCLDPLLGNRPAFTAAMERS
jgi:hypothetical protein